MADDKKEQAEKVEGVKVFCGNLSFSVQEAELQNLFASAGKVLSVNIISRGARSRGYGFVEMATQAEAEKAVEQFNKHNLSGRELKVEVAKPREEHAEGEAPAAGRGRGRARGGAAAAGAAAGAGEGRAARGGARGRARGRGGRGRGRGGRGRARGDKKSGEDRELSSDTLFVANLPFSTTDESLKELFGEFKPKEAHVVTGRGGRSKGFGFVVFESKANQEAALQKLDKTELEGREIAVRVAFNADEADEAEEGAKAE